MTLTEQTGQLAHRLKKGGLNPFDILTWEDLLVLYVDLRHVARRGISDDAARLKGVLRGMWAAMVRKANAYESEYATDERTSLLQELRNS